MKSSVTHNCAQCGSPLILISTVTEKLDGALFPQTTSTYRCSDPECQERRDKEMEKRLELREERAKAEKERFLERQKKKMIRIN